MNALHFERLGFTYPDAARAALTGVDMRIDGGLTLIAGASGSGKSTLLRVCNGLIPHFHGGLISGRATVFGHDVARTATRDLARHVGFVFQDPELQAVHARVERDVAFGLENLRVGRAEMIARVDEALHRCGIDSLRSRTVRTLSGGERQRVALAGVLAMRPGLLVLDEPLSQLDGDGARAIVTALADAMDAGTAVFVAEHRDRWLRPLATATLTIAEGRVTADSSMITAAWPPAEAIPHAIIESASRPGTGAGRAIWHLHGVVVGHGGTPLLHDVDAGAAAGEVIALTGPNGSGKTTLLRTIAGLLTPLSGRVERAPGRAAYLPQNPTALLHRQTLRAEVEWTLRHDPGGADANTVLQDFGLTHVAARYPRDLSTGERQRAALAAVLAGAPVLALLDEPTRGMDAAARAALARAVIRLLGGGTSVVLATHDEALVRQVATRVLDVRDGRVRERPAETMATA